MAVEDVVEIVTLLSLRIEIDELIGGLFFVSLFTCQVFCDDLYLL